MTIMTLITIDDEELARLESDESTGLKGVSSILSSVFTLVMYVVAYIIKKRKSGTEDVTDTQE